MYLGKLDATVESALMILSLQHCLMHCVSTQCHLAASSSSRLAQSVIGAYTSQRSERALSAMRGSFGSCPCCLIDDPDSVTHAARGPGI